MTKPYKSQALPASIKTQVDALRAAIVDANRKLDQAEADLKMTLDTFHGLIGKVAEAEELYGFKGERRRTRFRIENVRYSHSKVVGFSGRIIKKDGSPGTIKKRVYSWDIENGHVTVLDDDAQPARS